MKDNLALLKNVGIWIRVSTESQAQSDSPEIHLQRARAYALAKGWNALEVYNLAGVSGKAVMEHSEAKRMMADIKRGHISGLIFSNLSRLSRNLREIQDFGDFFRQNNADLISLNEAIDTSTAGGRMFFNLLGVFAQWYREDITDKIHASFLTRAKLGKLLNSNVPYGYKVVKGQMVQHPDEARTVFAARVAGINGVRSARAARVLPETAALIPVKAQTPEGISGGAVRTGGKL